METMKKASLIFLLFYITHVQCTDDINVASSKTFGGKIQPLRPCTAWQCCPSFFQCCLKDGIWKCCRGPIPVSLTVPCN
ncbi:unnamed protein product [Nezara viridula]|uniref:Neuropeptide n=1 Tax=Nezara viridula TaxID=85310 RepID=A0A9P0EBX4_NEZVI|nr:unnamed protein product [Nezara viridula]